MEAIKAKDYTIYFNNSGYVALSDLIENSHYSIIFILTDRGTNIHCLPLFKKKFKTNKKVKYLEISEGEEYKTLKTCHILWQELCDLEADRSSLIINLGGGVVTDLGGFVAATFKRGIDFLNIPTTLLGMVDAAIGGKTGVNLGALKNQVGCFANPKMLIIDTEYLKTLPQREIRSGMAEIIKYGLSYDATLHKNIIDNISNIDTFLEEAIYRSVIIKSEVVLKDPTEQNLRKILNFGHSLGHAIESYFLKDDAEDSLTHGEAVAIGMVTALYLSHKYCNFSIKKANTIKSFIHSYFGKVTIDKSIYPAIIDLLKHDKKAEQGIVKFILINDIGQYQLNCKVSEEAIIASLNYYTV